MPDTATDVPQVVEEKLNALPEVLVTLEEVGTVKDSGPMPVFVRTTVAVDD